LVKGGVKSFGHSESNRYGVVCLFVVRNFLFIAVCNDSFLTARMQRARRGCQSRNALACSRSCWEVAVGRQGEWRRRRGTARACCACCIVAKGDAWALETRL
jgi:hypothetical protein